MWAAGKLYGFSFTQVHDVPLVQPDVTVYEVTRDGKHVGLWYFDPYARDGKQSGAWMNEYRTQEHFKDDVTDPKLQQDVRAFCGQEGIQAREHRAYNAALARYPNFDEARRALAKANESKNAESRP